jgi:hypothetical protein
VIILMWVLLPTRLSHAWNQTFVSILTKTNAAQAELAVHRAGPTAQLTTTAQASGVLRFLFRLGDFRCACHVGNA